MNEPGTSFQVSALNQKPVRNVCRKVLVLDQISF